jgi:hypothetical protein
MTCCGQNRATEPNINGCVGAERDGHTPQLNDGSAVGPAVRLPFRGMSALGAELPMMRSTLDGGSCPEAAIQHGVRETSWGGERPFTGKTGDELAPREPRRAVPPVLSIAGRRLSLRWQANAASVDQTGINALNPRK